MKLSFLLKGNGIKKQFVSFDLPGNVRRVIGTYKAEGGNLYFVDFISDGNNLGSAKILAQLRDQLPIDSNVRILHDGASAKFCEILYPHFCRFEKGLRGAITVAICAQQGNFDDERIIDLEEKYTLEHLYRTLFVDDKFLKAAKKLIDRNPTKDSLKAELDALEEQILWNVLFSDQDMPTLRERRNDIRNRRNDVMHYHKMTEAVFDETRKLLERVNSEIATYHSRVRNDVNYPKANAESAKIAAQMISEKYADMLEGITSSFGASGIGAFFEEYSRIRGAMPDSISVSGIADAMQSVVNISSNLYSSIENTQTNTLMLNLDNLAAYKNASSLVQSAQSTFNYSIADSVKSLSEYPANQNALSSFGRPVPPSKGYSIKSDIDSALSDASGDAKNEIDDGHSDDEPGDDLPGSNSSD